MNGVTALRCRRCGEGQGGCGCPGGGDYRTVPIEEVPPPDDPAVLFEDPVGNLLAELLDTDDLENIPSLEPLIADTLFLDTVTRVYGESGAFKSFITLDFAGCVGTGKDWQGHDVRQGLVVYLVAEGAKGIRKRVRAWEQHYGRKMTGVKFLPRPLQVMGPEWEVLVEACRRLNPSLIIFDTQARVTVGVEENSATEMGRVLHHVEHLRAVSGACVLLVHHSGVAGDRGRGSTSIKGGMQTELSVSRKGKGVRDTRVTLKTDKQKDDDESDDLVFVLKLVELKGEAKDDGSPVTSVVLVSETGSGPAQGTVAYYVALLDAAGIPAHGRDKTKTEASKHDIVLPGNNQTLSEIVRVRKERSDLSQNLSQALQGDTCPGCGDSFDVSAAHTCPGQLGDSFKQASPDLSAPSLPLRRGQVGQPTCLGCGYPIDPPFDQDGATRHPHCRAKSETCPRCGFGLDESAHELNCETAS